MPIRAITFDFWCTLFRDAHSEPRQALRLDALVRATGVTRKAAERALQEVWTEFTRCHREEQRTLTPCDAVRWAAHELGVTLPDETAQELAHVFGTAILEHPPEPIEDALEAVRAAAGYGPVGLISDTGVSPGSSLRVLLDRYRFTPWFTALTFSDEVGVSKPQPPMFERTAERLGVRCKDLLHIGDVESTDIAGAKSVRARAALFLGNGSADPNNTSANYRFRTWRDFIDSLPYLYRGRNKT